MNIDKLSIARVMFFKEIISKYFERKDYMYIYFDRPIYKVEGDDYLLYSFLSKDMEALVR